MLTFDAPGPSRPDVIWGIRGQRTVVMNANCLLSIALATACTLSCSISSCRRSEDSRQSNRSSSELFSGSHVRLGTLPPKSYYTRGVRPYRREVLRLAFSPNSKLVAGSSPDGLVRVWKITSKEMLYSRQTTIPQYRRAHAPPVAFSPDGKCLAVGDRERIVLLSSATGEEIRSHDSFGSRTMSLCYSPNGAQLAVLTVDREVAPEATDFLFHWKTARVHDVQMGKVVLTIPKLSHSRLTYVSDGRRIATWGSKGLRIWDAADGRELHSIKGKTFAVSPDRRTVAAFGPDPDWRIRVWDTIKGTKIAVFHPAGQIEALRFSPDGKTLAAANSIYEYDHRWRIYDIHSGAIIARGSEHEAAVRAVAFSPDGKLLATGSDDTTIVIRRLPDHVRDPQPLPDEMIPKPFLGKSSHLGAIDFSPDGKTVVSAGPDNSFVVWDVETRKPVRRIEGHDGHIWSLAFFPDGQRVLARPLDGMIRVWDVQNGRQLQQHVLPSTPDLYWKGPAATRPTRGKSRFITGKPRMLGVSPDCSTIVYKTGGSHVLWTWNTNTGKVSQRLVGHTGPVRCAAISADGGKVASGGTDKTVRVWDASTGRELHQFKGHLDKIRCLAFSADGRYVVSGSKDRTIRVWDLKLGRQRHCFVGHSNGVECLAVSPDGRRVLSGGWDRTLRLWDMETGRQLTIPRFHEIRGRITSVAFSPDSTYAVYSDSHGTLWKRRLPE